eukprot:jgi/Psemu1/18043/gm1.18043_g
MLHPDWLQTTACPTALQTTSQRLEDKDGKSGLSNSLYDAFDVIAWITRSMLKQISMSRYHSGVSPRDAQDLFTTREATPLVQQSSLRLSLQSLLPLAFFFPVIPSTTDDFSLLQTIPSSLCCTILSSVLTIVLDLDNDNAPLVRIRAHGRPTFLYFTTFAFGCALDTCMTLHLDVLVYLSLLVSCYTSWTLLMRHFTLMHTIMLLPVLHLRDYKAPHLSKSLSMNRQVTQHSFPPC